MENTLKQENLAANFCGLLAAKNYMYLAIEWRILGQEQDGSLLASWVTISHAKNTGDKATTSDKSHIGHYRPADKTFDILHSFQRRENVIQASINASRTLLSYVIKNTVVNDENGVEQCVYTPYIVEIKGETEPSDEFPRHKLLPDGKTKQVMTQFLWPKNGNFEKTYQDKLLVFVHEENIFVFKTVLIKLANNPNPDDICSSKIDLKDLDLWCLDRMHMPSETIVKHFIWAQWDPTVQALYYIHLKPTMRGLLEKVKEEDKFTTTLSAHQFHEVLPRETVVCATNDIFIGFLIEYNSLQFKLKFEIYYFS